MASGASFRIGLLLYPECMPAGLFAFADLVQAANRRAGVRLFETVFVAQEEGRVACAHGQWLEARHALAQAALDAVLIPGFWGESASQAAAALAANAGLVSELARLPAKVMMWSYCTGVCLAAATGRLDGQQATVTWWLAQAMRESFPKAAWQIERTCVVNRRTATASGVNGYLPIAQAFIEQRVSKETYRDLVRLMVLPRPERTHDVFRTVHLIGQPSRLMRELQLVAEQTAAGEATVARLARELHVTERTLARKASEATGLPVASLVRRIKLNQVSERLIHTSASAGSISDELGFSSAAGMSRMFKELTGLTPGQYRQRFGRL